jgi:hypothetical protein
MKPDQFDARQPNIGLRQGLCENRLGAQGKKSNNGP